MSVNVIDTIKPKNGGSFPVVEAVDVAVSGSVRLNAALDAKANTSDLAAISTAIVNKADKSDISQLRTEIALKAPQSSLDATNVIVASKAAQSSLDALSIAVERKADKRDYDAIFAKIDTKADATALTDLQADMQQADTQLQNQIDQIEISASAEAVVAPEVAAARVGADGSSYSTLKERIDDENIQLNARVNSAKDEVGLRNVFDEADSDMLSGKYIDASGNEVTNANFCETGYISCTANDKLAVVAYNYNAAGDKTTSLLSVVYAVYDSGKNFVASGNTDTTNFITVNTASAAYIRVAIPAQYKNIAVYCSDIGEVGILPEEKSVYYKNANEQIADCSKNLSDLESQKIISKKAGNLPEDAYIIYGKYIDTETGNLGNSTTLSTIVCPYKPDTMAYILNCKDCFSSSGFSDEYVIRYRTSHGVILQSNLMVNVSQLAIYYNSDNMTVIIDDTDVKDIIITALTDYIDNISIITSDNSDEIANNKLPSDLIDLYNDIPTAHNILEESKCFGKLSVYKFPNETTWRAYYGTGETPIKSYGLYRLKKGETITAYGAQDLYICGFVLNKDLEVVQDLTILNGTTSTSYTAIEDCYLELSGNSLSDATKFIITKPKYAGSIPAYAIEGTGFGNQWYGKKWCALGTSLTSSSWGRYASRLAALSGMQEVNLGVPNGIIGPLGRSTERPSIMSQIANVPSDSDLITLEGFVNDWEEAGDFGEFGDTTADTFCGALYVALNALTSVSNAFVVGLTMPTGINTCNPYYKNQLNKYQYEYNDIFIKTCRAFGVPVIECDKCGVNVNTASLYLRDSIHHTDLGGQLIANYIWKQLERMDNKLLSL